MATQPPKNAIEFIEQQLDNKVIALEADFDADVLGFNGSIIFGVDDLARDVVEGMKAEAPSRTRLVMILTTDGGYIEVVQRVVEMLRHHYQAVEFVIPNYAFSAGTVLALSGDDIHMDYYSRLGPIDPQVETAEKRQVPALGYLHQYDRLVKKAEDGKITLAEMQLMIEGFDQALLYQYEQARELSVTLLTEWLATYKFKNWKKTEAKGEAVNDERRRERAKAIASELNKTEKWHSHGRGISREVLVRDLNLRIADFGTQPERSEKIKGYHRLLDDHMGNLGHRGVLHTVGNYVPFA